MLVVLCTIAGVLASTATQNNVYMIAATTLVLEQLMTADTALALALLDLAHVHVLSPVQHLLYSNHQA